VDELLQSGRCMVIRVSDRLSDHGASGLVAFRQEGESLVVEAMALSCPVLGKQVEYAVVAGLAQIASERQCAKLVFDYRASGRNQIMREFLKSVTEGESDGRFVLPVGLAQHKIEKAAVAAGTWTLEFGA
jgi:predicted enzyme involved in methoxymalonyl-ACP biosynthesis